MSKKKTRTVEVEDLKRLHELANTIHGYAETTKLSSLPEQQRVRVEAMSDYADQLQHGLDDMINPY